jgi:hypothetical protein
LARELPQKKRERYDCPSGFPVHTTELAAQKEGDKMGALACAHPETRKHWA